MVTGKISHTPKNSDPSALLIDSLNAPHHQTNHHEQRVATLREALEAATSSLDPKDIATTKQTFENEEALLLKMRLKFLEAPHDNPPS